MPTTPVSATEESQKGVSWSHKEIFILLLCLVLTYLSGTIFSRFPSLLHQGGRRYPRPLSLTEMPLGSPSETTGDVALSWHMYWVGDTMRPLEGERARTSLNTRENGACNILLWGPEVFVNFKTCLKWPCSVASCSVLGERKVQYGVGVTISVGLSVAISSGIMSDSHIDIIIHYYYWQDKKGTIATKDSLSKAIFACVVISPPPSIFFFPEDIYNLFQHNWFLWINLLLIPNSALVP